MSPQTIARKAWTQRNTRPPLDTIMAALGMERVPSPFREPEQAKRLREHEDAYLAYAWKQMEQTDRLCRNCKQVLPKHRRGYCSKKCQRQKNNAVESVDLSGRNREIVRLYGAGHKQRDIAEAFGLGESTVSDVLRQWRGGTGWARGVDSYEEAA